MSEEVNWDDVLLLLDALYTASDRLETLFPGRKFTLDGHLVGSIGEVLAAYMFDLSLLRGSNKGHDATTHDGRKVEVKMTQGYSVAIRYEPDHLIVLQRIKGSKVNVVFNGPGTIIWKNAGKLQSNGQRPISVQKLRQLDAIVMQADRLAQYREAPI